MGTAAGVDMGKMIPFDTLAYAKKLESRGVETRQAEAHAEVLAEVLEVNYPTRQDMGLAVNELSQRIDRLQSDMDAKFEMVYSKMEAGFTKVTSSNIKWVVGISFTQSAFLFSALKFFH